MTAETILYIILALFIGEFIFSKTLDYLNTKNWKNKLPEELKDIYDEKKYEKSMKYEKTNHKFSSITGIFSFIIMLLVLIFGGFGWLDNLVKTFTEISLLQSLYFFGIISVINSLISIPISYYSTFVIEEKFGFNKMTKKLFWLDTIKSFFLSLILGGVILALIIWIYNLDANNFWIYAWLLITFFSIFMMMFYSSLIVPLFNKQTPLEEGKLRSAIQEFADKVGFKLDNIFVIDGSKRSSKANAYFSGFGPKKRIVLYDTLIKDLEVEELVGVLAHEIGHYKRKHTFQMLAFSIIQTGAMLFILGLALKYPEISQALGAESGSFHVGAIAFGILFTPISIVLGTLSSILSRKNEYEADAFAKEFYDAEKLKSALIKLSRNNLSNLQPHPAYEFFHYSHPTVLKRLEALNK
ncbi:MAG: M48 family metallopeptidase [Candidatus Gracilibacteria bacterium]|nr:M48 family metallopeptidase [Candidatus Gracilibacteria bacterium]MDQ7023494.1 M48 family metallopeptidase [Candidatus Gracilibacteria bacterium]